MKAILKKKAYTLTELLVVLGVLTMAFSVLFVSTNSNDGSKLSSSQRILSGLVKSARAQAILKNARAQLIIHNDPSDLEKYRRYVGIVYSETDSSGATVWIASGEGTYLPKGIYFDRQTSVALSSWTGGTTNLDFPRRSAQTGSTGDEYLFYEFRPNGTPLDDNPYLVFRAGSMIPNDNATEVSEIRVSRGQLGIVSALILRTGGSATIINDPSDITVSSSSLIN